MLQIRAELEEKVGQTFPQYKAISYKSQIVAGTNYFVKVISCMHLPYVIFIINCVLFTLNKYSDAYFSQIPHDLLT